MFAKLHLVGTLWPLILPNLFGDAFSIFLLRQFFLTIPQEYARRGARRRRAASCGSCSRSSCALAKPAIAAVALFAFLYAWNDFFGPLLYTGENPDHWTVSVGLSQFRTSTRCSGTSPWPRRCCSWRRSSSLFFAAQKAFVEGVTLTGVKG